MSETMTLIAELLSQYAFPIVACVALFWLLYRMQEDARSRDQAFTTALMQNTTAIEEVKVLIQTLHGVDAHD